MLDALIKRLTGNAEAAPEDRRAAERTAIAALLVEAARADGVYLDEERSMIAEVLADRYGLDAAGADALRSEGETAQKEATDIVRFTRVLKDAIPHEDRVEILEAVWRVVYADGEGEAHETNLVRRLCGLLYIPDREAGLARQKVTGERS